MSCNPTCVQSYVVGSQVTLTANPSTSWSFGVWQNGPCAGSSNATCTFTMPAQNLTITAVFQGIATFTLKDKTNLTPGTYQIYVAGYSTAGPYVLNNDGTWIAPTVPTGGATLTIPCWRFPQDITQVTINSLQTAISARAYYFVVTDLNAFPSCNPTAGNTGLFNVAGAFTYTQASLNLATPPVSVVTSKAFPAWTFSEIGTSPFTGTIDLSQVDFFAFPMYTTATPSTGPSAVGNPVGTGNPGDAVNHVTIRDSYAKYINSLAEAANNNKSCDEDSAPSVCAYLELLQSVRTQGSQVAQYVIQNPGGYLGQNTSTTQSSRLNTAFDGVIHSLWHGTTSLTIDSGGALGGSPEVPEDVFTSTIVTMNYPGTTYSVQAMKFTGSTTGYIAYVFSPKDYENGCAGGQITNCTSPASSGWQVFAAGGMLATPPDSTANATYNALKSAGLLASNADTYGGVGYNAVVARLGFLIAGAMTRGVALASCSRTYTWQCWQDETYWYPTATSATYPDITQSVFARWMHTATIAGQPMFVQPANPVNSASSTPGGGKLMGMAYGISNDENPTPSVPNPPATVSPQPEVPSKFDSTVVFGGSGYEITFGPWVTGAALNPTLTVVLNGKGHVSSSPAGIDCDPTCSHAYPPDTQVILTAKSAKGWVFFRWVGGGCTNSHSTTCTVTLAGNTNTTVTAEFAEPLAATPPKDVLDVVVQGSGTVTSAPPGIDCGSSCSAGFNLGTTITLTATPGPGSPFAGWSGACAGSGTTCLVTFNAATSAGAAFVAATQYTLAVASGVGGVVTSLPAGIDCGTRCISGFAPGASVSLTAQPRPGYRFSGWTGACTGTQTCDLVMDGSKGVQAAFTAVAPGQYSLTVHDFGNGTIASFPGGIDCGNTCSAAFASGTKVTLVATPAAGFVFAGWGGDCAGTGACVIYVDDLMNVDATFKPSGVSGGPSAPQQPIPTLSEWALVLLTLLMMLVAARRAKERDGRGERI